MFPFPSDLCWRREQHEVVPSPSAYRYASSTGFSYSPLSYSLSSLSSLYSLYPSTSLSSNSGTRCGASSVSLPLTLTTSTFTKTLINGYSSDKNTISTTSLYDENYPVSRRMLALNPARSCYSYNMDVDTDIITLSSDDEVDADTDMDTNSSSSSSRYSYSSSSSYGLSPPVVACSAVSSSSSSSSSSTQNDGTSKTKTKAKAKAESPVAKFLISGVAAFGYELVIGHFLEFVKIAKQTNYDQSYFQLSRQMVAQKGIVGVLDGYFPWGAIQAVSKGAVFGFAHAAAAKALRPLEDAGTLHPRIGAIIAGGIGGGFQGVVLSPLLLLKTRVMTDPAFRSDMNGWETAKESARVGVKVIRREGPLALMKGSLVFSGKRVLDWATRYMFAEIFEAELKKIESLRTGQAVEDVKLSTAMSMTCSLLGGTASAFCTIPIDVMVAQIQQASKAGQNVGFFEMFRSQLKEGGIKGMFVFSTRGFIARVAHVALTTALMKTGASFLYDQWVKLAELVVEE